MKLIVQNVLGNQLEDRGPTLCPQVLRRTDLFFNLQYKNYGPEEPGPMLGPQVLRRTDLCFFNLQYYNYRPRTQDQRSVLKYFGGSIFFLFLIYNTRITDLAPRTVDRGPTLGPQVLRRTELFFNLQYKNYGPEDPGPTLGPQVLRRTDFFFNLQYKNYGPEDPGPMLGPQVLWRTDLCFF